MAKISVPDWLHAALTVMAGEETARKKKRISVAIIIAEKFGLKVQEESEEADGVSEGDYTNIDDNTDEEK